MKARTIFFVLVLFSLILSACGPKGPGGSVSFMVSGDPAELAAYQTLVDAFQKANPNIKVELIHIPDDGEYGKRLAADVAAGTPADVVLINYREYAGYAKAGALEPLGPYLAKSSAIKVSDFYPQAMEPFNWQGEQLGIPQNISSLVCYYNKDLFDKAGLAYPSANWTWDEFTADAVALTQDLNGDGTTDQFGVGIQASLVRMAPFIWQAGGQVVDYDANPSTLMLDTNEAYDAADFFFGLQTVHHVAPNREEEAAQGSQSRFLNGTMGMYFNSRRSVPTVRESAAFDWDVAPLPMGKTAASILHSDAYFMTSASKNKDAAWALIEFANSVEGQTIIAGTGRTVPSRIAVAESDAFLNPTAKPAHSQVWLDAIPTIYALPVHPNWGEIEDIANEELARGFYGEADPYDAMLRAVQRTREYFTGE